MCCVNLGIVSNICGTASAFFATKRGAAMHGGTTRWQAIVGSLHLAVVDQSSKRRHLGSNLSLPWNQLQIKFRSRASSKRFYSSVFFGFVMGRHQLPSWESSWLFALKPAAVSNANVLDSGKYTKFETKLVSAGSRASSLQSDLDILENSHSHRNTYWMSFFFTKRLVV